MWFMWLVSWASTFLLLICATLCIASGLYYIAEIVEEYPKPAKSFITYSIWLVLVAIAGMFLFERIPMNVTATGVLSHLVYMTLLKSFPNCSFSSLSFIGSLVLFVVQQYMVFQYFSSVWHPFSDVLTYFVICVWFIPFSFFVSLSASEGGLPTTSTEDFSSYRADGVQAAKKERMGVLSFLRGLLRKKDDFLPMQSGAKGL